MTKALQLARSFHAAGHRVVLVESGQVPADRAPVLPRRSTGSTPCPTRRTSATPRRCCGSCATRASTSTCRCAARRRATTTRWPSRCWSRTARSCTATWTPWPRWTTSTSSRRRAAALGLPVPDTHRVTGAADVEAVASRPGRAAAHPQEHPLRPGQPAGPDAAAAPDAGRDRGVRPRQADLAPSGRGSCRSSCAAPEYCTHSTAPRRRRAGLRLLRVLAVPGQLRDGRQAARSRRGCGVRSELRLTGQLSLRLHRGRGRAAVRDRVQPAHPLGDHDVPRPPGPGRRVPGGRPRR